jgi:hypothetical protein
MTLFREFCIIGQCLTTFSMCAEFPTWTFGKSSVTDKWTDTLELKLEIKELSILN